MSESKLTAVRGGLSPGRPKQPATDPEELDVWEHVLPRRVSGEEWERFRGYMAEIFAAWDGPASAGDGADAGAVPEGDLRRDVGLRGRSQCAYGVSDRV